MPRYEPAGAVEAHKTDNGDDYVIVAEGGVWGMMDAGLFERVFIPVPRLLDGLSPLERKRLKVDEWYQHPTKDAVSNVPFEEERPLPGVPVTAEDLVPASERLAARLAERTVPGGPGAARLPRPEQVEAVLEETRELVAAETRGRDVIDGGEEKSYEPKPKRQYRQVGALAKAERNRAIYKAVMKDDRSHREVADEYGLTPQRVSQIVTAEAERIRKGARGAR
jgi:hypothetical protein